MKQKNELIIFLDSGDTIIDEATEVREDDGIVIRADVIPGADVMVKTLSERGYTLVLVADGEAQSFKNSSYNTVSMIASMQSSCRSTSA
ncbi:hypothetical protein [Paenibacillus alkalitolerans]|uniref:hypothetical protein n=1 Tax=Paenibacillus alkalitolerans TaxID=2799335 RepID=UPI001F2DC318|nr:hypothetical protein [Paenibacillus alkalitolerans]